MQIIIEYEASWRNSFLDGSNNEPLPKTGRKFIGSMTNLNNEKNFIQRHVSLDTIMGLLNRLIGDQRKLYQAREQEDYFFKEIEPLVEFTDKPTILNHEMTYIRNITGSTDQNSYTGMIKVSDPIFQSDYSAEFWSVLNLECPILWHCCKSGFVPGVAQRERLSIMSASSANMNTFRLANPSRTVLSVRLLSTRRS